MGASSAARVMDSTIAPGTGWRGANRDLVREHGFEKLEIEGQLPDDLQGTLYRNGPMIFSNFGNPYKHPFDGDGGITAVRIGGGKAEGACRIIESRALRHERREGKALYRGFGTLPPGLRRFTFKFKNAANTNVIRWQNKLLACWEGGRPTEVSPEDLHTVGETSLGGVIRQAFTAHPHRVAKRKATYNFGMRMGRHTKLDLFGLPDEGAARWMGSIPLKGPTMIHDFICTDNHMVFFVPPVKLNPFPALLTIKEMSQCYSWHPEWGTEVIIVPYDDPKNPIRFRTEPFYQWHYTNAFEQGGKIIVDFVRYPNFDSMLSLTSWADESQSLAAALVGTPWRAELDPKAKKASFSRISKTCAEFPRVHPELEGIPTRLGYHVALTSETAMAEGMQDSLMKLDYESGKEESVTLGDEQYPCEPVFAPRPGAKDEEDGYLLTLVYDAYRDASHVAVFDARGLEDGPLARLWFDHHIPLSFHGNWHSA